MHSQNSRVFKMHTNPVHVLGVSKAIFHFTILYVARLSPPTTHTKVLDPHKLISFEKILIKCVKVI